ncbi:MAG: glycosyltransferase family 9 protein [Fibrobacterota bacterium]
MSETVLTVQLAGIGDMVLTTPLLKCLKDSGKKVHLIASGANHGIIREQPFIDKLLIYKKGLFGITGLIREIRKTDYDLYIDPKDHRSTESRIISSFVRADARTGFPANFIFKAPDNSVPSDPDNAGIHAAERNIRAAQKSGCETSFNRPFLEIPPDMENDFRSFCRASSVTKYVCVNISANSADRRWPPEKWETLCGELLLSCGVPGIVMISSPRDSEKARSICEKTGAFFYDSSDDIRKVMPVIKNSSAVITADTSIVHIASAFNAPLLALYLFNRRMYAKYKPLSDISETVFGKERDENSGVKTVEKIKLQDVLEAYKNISEKLSAG